MLSHVFSLGNLSFIERLFSAENGRPVFPPTLVKPHPFGGDKAQAGAFPYNGSHIVTSGAQLGRLEKEWQALHEQQGWSHFTDPRWYLAWWQHLGQAAGWRLHIVTEWEEGRLVAVAPLAVIRRKGVRLLQWAGTDVFDYCDAPALTPDHAAKLWHAVKCSRRYDLALLKSVREDSRSRPFLAGFASVLRQERNHYLALTWDSGAAWLSALPSAVRKEYKRRLRQLEERGPLSFRVAHRHGDAAREIETVLAQKKAWCVATHCDGVFDEPGAAPFFRAMAERAGEKSDLLVAELRCGEETVAAHLGFVQGKTAYWYMPSYDGKWASFSPGKVLMFKAIEWAIDQGFEEFDLLRGEERFKEQLTKEHRAMFDYSYSRGALGKLSERTYRQRQLRLRMPQPVAEAA